MTILIFQRIILDILWDIVYFPIWWYTRGAKRALLWCLKLFRNGNQILAPGIWLRNIFVPMYGQYDWQGRIVSFFMRLIQIFFRSIALLFWFVISLGLFFVYLALLPLAFLPIFIG